MVDELKYPDDVQKRIDEKISAKDYKKYGNWTRIEGKLEDFTESEIEEFKELIYESASESLQAIGVDIKDQQIEWVIQQAYYDGERLFSEYEHKNFPEDCGGEPCVTIAWKTKVKNDG